MKHWLLTLTLVLFFFLPSAFAQLLPIVVEATRSEESLIFTAVFKRPEDMLDVLSPYRHGNHFARWIEPRLRSREGTAVNAYLEASDPINRFSFPAELTFIGRTKPVDALKLFLEYPTRDGNWKSQKVSLDFRGAKKVLGYSNRERRHLEEELMSQSTLHHVTTSTIQSAKQIRSNSPSIPERTALQRWADAQSKHFSFLQTVYGDTGGFFAFASAQTNKKYQLPANADRLGRTRFNFPVTSTESSLYDLTTGGLAIQESLQLDRILQPTTKESRTISVGELQGVTVKSHPFDEMRKGREPKYRKLAELVPSDNYYLAFDNISKMFSLFDFLDQWGSTYFSLYEPVTADYRVREKLHNQLCLPSSLLSRIFGPAVVSQVALTGSDPYLREGSDVTILFEVSAREVFEPALQSYFEQAKTSVSSN